MVIIGRGGTGKGHGRRIWWTTTTAIHMKKKTKKQTNKKKRNQLFLHLPEIYPVYITKTFT